MSDEMVKLRGKREKLLALVETATRLGLHHRARVAQAEVDAILGILSGVDGAGDSVDVASDDNHVQSREVG